MEFSSIALPTTYAIPPLPLTSHHYRIYPSTQVTHLILVYTTVRQPPSPTNLWVNDSLLVQYENELSIVSDFWLCIELQGREGAAFKNN